MCLFKNKLYISPDWINKKMQENGIDDDFEKIKTQVPELVTYVKGEYNKLSKVFLITLIIVVVVWAFVHFFVHPFTPWLGILYGIIGTFLISKSSMSRSYKAIVVLSTTRFTYSKSLVDDLLLTKRDSSIGIVLFAMSILIEAVYLVFPTLIGSYGI